MAAEPHAPALLGLGRAHLVLELLGERDAAHELSAVVRALVAHELVIRGPLEVGVREVAVEGALELPLACSILSGRGWTSCREVVKRAAVGGDDGVDVVGRLHAPLDLERAHARLGHRGKIPERVEVLGAERALASGGEEVLPALVDELVGQTAGLRADAAVCRAPTEEGAHEADARVAEADGAVAEALQIDALTRDGCDLGQRELAREGHALGAVLAAPAHTARIMDVGLRGDVALDLGPTPADLVEQSPILDDEGIGAEPPRLHDGRERPLHLVVLDHDVDGHVDAGIGEMRVAAGALERLGREVVGHAPRVEVVAERAVDGVGTSGEGGVERLRFPGGGKELGDPVGLGGHYTSFAHLRLPDWRTVPGTSSSGATL